MTVVNHRTAQMRLSRLVDRAAEGEEIIITKGGRPIARLLPLVSRKPRRLGLLKGKASVPPDFDAPLPDDLLALFEGR